MFYIFFNAIAYIPKIYYNKGYIN